MEFEEIFNHSMIEAVKHYEGLYLKPYSCSSDQWIIGYGHQCSADHPEITEDIALQYLYEDLELAYSAVKKLWKNSHQAELHQLVALTSWTFNLGEHNLSNSTLLKKLNQGKLDEIPEEIKKWNKIIQKGHKVILNGLVKRRMCEAVCFRDNIVRIY